MGWVRAGNRLLFFSLLPLHDDEDEDEDGWEGSRDACLLMGIACRAKSMQRIFTCLVCSFYSKDVPFFFFCSLSFLVFNIWLLLFFSPWVGAALSLSPLPRSAPLPLLLRKRFVAGCLLDDDLFFAFAHNDELSFIVAFSVHVHADLVIFLLDYTFYFPSRFSPNSFYCFSFSLPLMVMT